MRGRILDEAAFNDRVLRPVSGEQATDVTAGHLPVPVDLPRHAGVEGFERGHSPLTWACAVVHTSRVNASSAASS